MKILYILIYLAYYDKTFILNIAYDREVTQDLHLKLSKSPLLQLLQDSLVICENRA